MSKNELFLKLKQGSMPDPKDLTGAEARLIMHCLMHCDVFTGGLWTAARTKLPSQLRMNHQTVKRTLMSLKEKKIITTHRTGGGTFIKLEFLKGTLGATEGYIRSHRRVQKEPLKGTLEDPIKDKELDKELSKNSLPPEEGTILKLSSTKKGKSSTSSSKPDSPRRLKKKPKKPSPEVNNEISAILTTLIQRGATRDTHPSTIATAMRILGRGVNEHTLDNFKKAAKSFSELMIKQHEDRKFRHGLKRFAAEWRDYLTNAPPPTATLPVTPSTPEDMGW